MTLSERITLTSEMLLAAARAADMTVTGDLRLAEGDLERLLGYAPRALRALREEGRAPPGYHIGNRWTYRACDVAAWIEMQREEWH